MPVARALAGAAALLALAPRAAAFTTTIIDTRTPIGANRTINATEVWAVEGGGCLDVAERATLTVVGVLSAPPMPIFCGRGRVLLASGLTQEIYPQWWGAVGDGVTDDTAALQAAFDALPNNEDTVQGVSGRVVIPRGDYIVTKPLVLGGGGEVRGDGAVFRARDQTGDKLPAIMTIRPGRVTRNSTTIFWRLKSLRFVGSGRDTSKGTFTSVGLDFASVSYAIVEDIGISDCVTALKLDGAFDIFVRSTQSFYRQSSMVLPRLECCWAGALYVQHFSPRDDRDVPDRSARQLHHRRVVLQFHYWWRGGRLRGGQRQLRWNL